MKCGWRKRFEYGKRRQAEKIAKNRPAERERNGHWDAGTAVDLSTVGLVRKRHVCILSHHFFLTFISYVVVLLRPSVPVFIGASMF